MTTVRIVRTEDSEMTRSVNPQLHSCLGFCYDDLEEGSLASASLLSQLTFAIVMLRAFTMKF